MRRGVRITVYVVALVSLATLSAFADGQRFTVTLAATKESLKAGKALLLEATVTNTGNRIEAFGRSPGPDAGWHYHIYVRDSRGQAAPPSAFVRSLKNKRTVFAGSEITLWLEPGESFVEKVDVARLYDLSQPGKYTVRVARTPEPSQTLAKDAVWSNTITVTVVK